MNTMGYHHQSQDFYSEITELLYAALQDFKSSDIDLMTTTNLLQAWKQLRCQKGTAVTVGVFDNSSTTEVAEALTAIGKARSATDLAGPLKTALQIVNVAVGHAFEAHNLIDARDRAGFFRFFRLRRLNKSALKVVAAEHRAVDLALTIVRALVLTSLCPSES